MRGSVWTGLLVGVWMLMPSPSSGAEMMRPGLWEITTTMEMQGMSFQMPSQTTRHCYTAQEVKEDPVPKDANCKITDLKTSGNKTSWKMECKGEMAGTGEGEVTHLGDSAYEGKSTIKTQGMTMTMKYKGKRLGECE